MIKGLIVFGAGIYTGVFIAQNYEIEKVNDPWTLLEKAIPALKAKFEEFTKDSKK